MSLHLYPLRVTFSYHKHLLQNCQSNCCNICSLFYKLSTPVFGTFLWLLCCLLLQTNQQRTLCDFMTLFTNNSSIILLILVFYILGQQWLQWHDHAITFSLHFLQPFPLLNFTKKIYNKPGSYGVNSITRHNTLAT